MRDQHNLDVIIDFPACAFFPTVSAQ